LQLAFHQVTFHPPKLRYLQLILANAINADKLRLKDQHAVSRNRPRAPAAVRPVRLDCELPLLADAHVKKTLVPALDDLALSNRETEGLAAAVRRVELGAVGLEGSAVCGVLGDSLPAM
jgi:hypothetical protein